jgi:hypothetical protein
MGGRRSLAFLATRALGVGRPRLWHGNVLIVSRRKPSAMPRHMFFRHTGEAFDCEGHGSQVFDLNRRESRKEGETAEVSVVFPPCARESELRRWT